MVFVADADGVSFGFEILVFELNDKFSDVFCQFFVTQSIAELLLFELLTIFVRDGEYDRQVIGRDIPCLLSVADTDNAFVFRFTHIEFALRIQYVVFAGVFVVRVPPDPLSFFECCHSFSFYFVSSGISFPV